MQSVQSDLGFFEIKNQRLAALEARRVTAWPNLRRALAARVALPAQRLASPRPRVAAALGALALLDGRMRAAAAAAVARRRAEPAFARLTTTTLAALLRERRARLAGAAGGLDALSHARVLARGFALVTAADGRLVTSAAEVRPGVRLGLEFADGAVQAVAAGAPPRAHLPKPAQETLL